ncbi:metallophosphoesterase [uncultured Victivallis sp.]|uniref:metallophosphoesterase n=1 Tax=uncultured Victivallis sp. TaxID=354118 RepID=UPI0025F1C55C|nr:metallophosphoesterase [uncultured Victivallis sp.]
MRIFRNATHLFLNIQARETSKVIANAREDGYAALAGDHVEIFFGESGENGWYRHFAVSAGGGRFSEFAKLSDWEAVTAVADDRWSAEIRLPLSLLPLTGESVGFNIARQRSAAKQLLVWVHTGSAFHNIDRLGRLYFLPPEPECVLHGPWVCQPDSTSVEIGWETAGAGAAVVEYRRKGETEFRIAYADPVSGTIRRDKSLHRARLKNLTPGSEYEYQLKMLFPELGKESPATGLFSFRTNAGSARDFSLLLTSDLHCRTGELMRILHTQEADNADFAILLGDMVTASPGRRIYYDGFLDAMLREWRKPFVISTGNHEFRGCGAGAWFDLFAGRDGSGYFTFSHGGVFFIVLDVAGDYNPSLPELEKAYRTRQREWLQTVTESGDFLHADFRVVLSHEALVSPELGSHAVFEMIDGLLTGPGVIDLMIGGHEHCYCRSTPGEKALHCNSPKLCRYPAWALPFPVVLNDYCAHLELSRQGDVLTVRAFDSTGKNIDSFSVAQAAQNKTDLEKV